MDLEDRVLSNPDRHDKEDSLKLSYLNFKADISIDLKE